MICALLRKITVLLPNGACRKKEKYGNLSTCYSILFDPRAILLSDTENYAAGKPYKRSNRIRQATGPRRSFPPDTRRFNDGALSSVSEESAMGQISQDGDARLDVSGVAVNHFDITRKELHLAGGPSADAAPAASRWSELEAALRECRSMALAGQFAATTMHVISGPLEAITNLNYLLRINCGGNARALSYSHQIEEQLQFLAGITRQTLSYYRVHPQPESLAVSVLVEAALRIHQHKVRRNEIHLVKELPSDILAEVHPGSMLQVFSNLIGNALEAMPAGGTLWLRVKCSETEVHIVVADRGAGLPAPIRGKIFEPFFSTKRERGTGLGLAITKSIVEKHSGRIRSWTSTSSGRSGTAFRISLPISLGVPPVTA